MAALSCPLLATEKQFQKIQPQEDTGSGGKVGDSSAHPMAWLSRLHPLAVGPARGPEEQV